ncbi:hypothetical protein J5T34_22105 [Cupriavidus gilardii]|uniref:hypothetical protein n=1 Tax=Cupriavidus gilardii TaxID=82541 RepID=UPI001ABEDBBE|nr:hypothetical protein [Cupriavidus gilardii]MBO4123429.1 hypothetical protein [Cupriavidus gilardii]
MQSKSTDTANPVAPQTVKSLTPDKGPLEQERGQNPAGEADTLPSESQRAESGTQAQQGQPGSQQGGQQAGQQGRKPGVTPNEIMNEQVSPPDEQGDRTQSDRPHIGG